VVSDLDAIEVRPRPCWIGGRAEQGERILTVRHPYDGTEVADVAMPDAMQIERAIAAAHDVAREFAAMPARARATALRDAAESIVERAEEIAETITAENGKPLARAHAEVHEAVATFRCAADEAIRLAGLAGELRRPDADTAGASRNGAGPDQGERGLAMVRRRSRGPVLAITPNTFPLRLVAHQVAAALAVGAPVVVKPSSATPMTALLLGEILAETVLPAGAFSVLPVAGSALGPLIEDARLPVLSFTGSPSVGASIAAAAPRKHVVLAPGGESAVVICPDWASDDDLDAAARRIVTHGGVRRVIVHASVADRFVPRLVDAVAALRTGDPHDPDVDVGPLADEAAAGRVVEWIEAAGGQLLTGGTRTGASVTPAVLLAVSVDTVPEPVLVVSVVDSVAAAFAQATGPRAGVFTHDLATAFDAPALIDAAALVIGDVPSDHGPEHVRAAMLEFTTEQVVGLRIG
jgi:acyl-CoA reductase-like NAD-dependent aldehyde dehydrogenase